MKIISNRYVLVTDLTEVFQPSKYLEYIAFKFILINERQTGQAVLLPKPRHRADLFEKKMRSHSRLTLTEEVKQQNHHQTCSASSAEFLHSVLLSTCSRRLETESTTTTTHHTPHSRKKKNEEDFSPQLL